MRSNQEVSQLRKELCRIHSGKLYKETHSRFEVFVRERYGISAEYAYGLIAGRRRYRKGLSERLRWEIWERDNFTCAYCGARKFLCVDHKTPRDKGGTDDPENLITACHTCNSRKGVKSYLGFYNPILASFQIYERLTK